MGFARFFSKILPEVEAPSFIQLHPTQNSLAHIVEYNQPS
jgi:hypothetical protein